MNKEYNYCRLLMYNLLSEPNIAIIKTLFDKNNKVCDNYYPVLITLKNHHYNYLVRFDNTLIKRILENNYNNITKTEYKYILQLHYSYYHRYIIRKQLSYYDIVYCKLRNSQ
jgi:hypothetical protein